MIELRSFVGEDAAAVQRLLNDQEVSQYLTSRVSFPYTLDQAVWWVEEGSHSSQSQAIIWDKQLVGCIGVEKGTINQEHTGEISYWIGKSFWGKGIATKALIMMTENIFQSGETTRLTAGVFHPNKASMRVLEKAGFALEGIFKMAFLKNGQYYDKHQYVRLLT